MYMRTAKHKHSRPAAVDTRAIAVLTDTEIGQVSGGLGESLDPDSGAWDGNAADFVHVYEFDGQGFGVEPDGMTIAMNSDQMSKLVDECTAGNALVCLVGTFQSLHDALDQSSAARSAAVQARSEATLHFLYSNYGYGGK